MQNFVETLNSNSSADVETISRFAVVSEDIFTCMYTVTFPLIHGMARSPSSGSQISSVTSL